MLIVVMLSVITLNAFMLSVVVSPTGIRIAIFLIPLRPFVVSFFKIQIKSRKLMVVLLDLAILSLSLLKNIKTKEH
jgi:hypothetical protein